MAAAGGRRQAYEGETGKKLYFPPGALLNDMEVAVVESERRKSEILKEPFIVYLVESRPIETTLGGATGCALWRRYSEFELLRNYLMAIYPFIAFQKYTGCPKEVSSSHALIFWIYSGLNKVVMPPLPEKRINVVKLQLATDKFDPEFIERRRQGLECFLLRLASHALLSQDTIFLAFLNQEDGWKESVNATNFQAKVDGRFKSLSASMNLKKPDKRFEDIKSYSDSLGTNLSALLKVQQRMTARDHAVSACHGNYGKLFRNLFRLQETGQPDLTKLVSQDDWSTIENEMADGLQRAGHHMDRFSQQLSTVLDEEGVSYIDQLKEYLFFTESLKTIVKKQNLRQYDLEKTEELLAAKAKQRDDVFNEIQIISEGGEPESAGFSFKGVSQLLFGAETLDTKEAKYQEFGRQVTESEELVRSKQEEVGDFVDKSLHDYDRFKKQKVRDLQEVMESYIKMQIKLCKMGLNSWQSMKDSFASM